MANPDVDVVIPLFESLERAYLSWLANAYGSAPFSVGDCPAIINIPGAAVPDWSIGSDDQAQEGYEARTYIILLLEAPSGSGISGEVITRVNPHYAAIRNLFTSHTVLGSPTSGILEVEWTGDSGLTLDIEVGGIKYTGTRATVKVTGRVRVPFAQGE